MQHLERRSKAHEKLLLHAYYALSQFGIKQNKTDMLDAVKKPKVYEMEEEKHSTAIAGDKQSKLNPEDEQMLINVEECMSPASKLQFFEHFVLKLKTSSIEVLKLNRDNKWQPRFLTLTKEMRRQKSKNSNQIMMQCPKGILWLKKFQKKREYSIRNTDKNGKGGMDLMQLIGVELMSDINSLPVIPKKLQARKYKNANTAITLHFSIKGDNNKSKVVRRKIMFLSQTKSDAVFLLGGFTIIKEILHNNDAALQKLPESSSVDKEDNGQQRNDVQVNESVNNITSNTDEPITLDTKNPQSENSDRDDENVSETSDSKRGSQSECSSASSTSVSEI